MIKVLASLILVLCLGLIWSLPVAATIDSIGIAPGDMVGGRLDDGFHYHLLPGSSVHDSVKIINHSPEPRRFNLTASTARIAEDGSLSCEPATAAGSGRWLQLEQTAVTVASNDWLVVPFTLTVPKAAVAGEHNACLAAAEVTRPGAGGSGTTLNLQTQLVYRVAVTIPGDISWSLLVEKPKVAVSLRDVKVILPQHNISSISLNSSTAVSYRQAVPGGRSLPKTKGLILPKSTNRTVITDLPRPFWGGWYNLNLTTTYSPADKELSAAAQSKTISTSIRYLVWPEPLALAVIGLSAGLLIWLIRRLQQLKNRRRYKLRRSG